MCSLDKGWGWKVGGHYNHLMKSPSGKPHILIAGGGIGGLTAAQALLKRGFNVDVYEQAADLREVGASLQISPKGKRA